MTTSLRRRLTLLAALSTVLLAVLDQNIVSAASLPIVTDLDPAHGLDRLPWLVSAYALASAAALPLYGKLCDTIGAKRVFLAAVAVFLLGSMLCGAATDLGALIAFRAVQGLGGGGLMSVTMVLMAELTTPGDRGRNGGLGGIVAGVGLAAGPLAGGQLAEHLGWRWIFYVNVPLGLAILAVIALAAPASVRHRPHRIDYAGAALAAALACVLLLITDWGGDRYAWTSAPMLGLIVLAPALLTAFLWRQHTAAEPILPLSLFRDRTFRVALPVQALVGFGMIGAIIYTLLYLQVARSVPAGSSGLHLIPLALGMVISGVAGDRLTRGGDRGPLLCGLAATACAITLLGLLGTETPYPLIWVALALLGAGLGQVVGRLISLTQNAVDGRHLGVATTAIRFAQTLGGALGAALSGTVLVHRFAAGSPTTDPAAIPALPPADRLAALHAFVAAVDSVFLTAGAVMAAAVALALLLPRPISVPEAAA